MNTRKGYQPRAGKPIAERDVYTTSEVARICRISQQTVIREFDAGRLPGYRVPGSRFRRITALGLRMFMSANNIPEEFLTTASEETTSDRD